MNFRARLRYHGGRNATGFPAMVSHPAILVAVGLSCQSNTIPSAFRAPNFRSSK
jgi:hypothetical protein